jgi:Activator of Hsp90 ATPase homolog 1-like protein
MSSAFELGFEEERRVYLSRGGPSPTAETRGAETVVIVELQAKQAGTDLRLTHAGFPDKKSMKRHEDAWPKVLAGLDEAMSRLENARADGWKIHDIHLYFRRICFLTPRKFSWCARAARNCSIMRASFSRSVSVDASAAT